MTLKEVVHRTDTVERMLPGEIRFTVDRLPLHQPHEAPHPLAVYAVVYQDGILNNLPCSPSSCSFRTISSS